MIIPSRVLEVSGLLLLASLSFAVLFFIFEYQYMWHVDTLRFWILRSGFVVGGMTLIALLVFFPNYLAVITVGVIILAFPAFISGVPDMKFSLIFSIAMTLDIVLLVATTALRRGLFPQS